MSKLFPLTPQCDILETVFISKQETACYGDNTVPWELAWTVLNLDVS